MNTADEATSQADPKSLRGEFGGAEFHNHASENRVFYLGLVAGVLVLFVLALPLFQGQAYTADDLGNFHLPMRFFYHRCLMEGDSFLWTPDIFCGFYVHGDGQVGMCHPLHLVLYGILPLQAAFCLEMLLSYPFMLAGTFLFLRRWRLPPGPALFGGLVFAYSGFSLLHYMHMNVVAVVAHLPWLLLAIHVAMRSKDGRQVAVAQLSVGLLTASQLLLGFPQAVWFSALVEVVYLGCVVTSWRSWPRLWWLGVGKVLGAVAAGIQVLPTLDALSQSVRSDASAGFSYAMSLHPANLVQLVAPYLFKGRVLGSHTHEFALYNGALVPVLLVMLLIRVKDLRFARRLAVCGLILAALSLVLAMGKHGYLYRLQVRLPLIGKFRCPTRYIVLFHFATAVVSAIALADLAKLAQCRGRMAWRRLWPLAFPPAASVLIAASALLWAAARPESDLAGRVASWPKVLIGPMLVIMATALVVAALRGRRHAIVAIVLLGVADQAIYGLSFIRKVPPWSIARFLDSRDRPPEVSRHRIYTCGHAEVHSSIMRGLRFASGYAGLPPSKTLCPVYNGSLRVAAVGWVKAPFLRRDQWLKVQARLLPRARLVSRVVVSPDPNAYINAVEVETTGLVSEPIRLPGGAPGQATIISDRPGSIRVITSAPTQQLLIVSESYHKGWRVRVDSEPRPVVRVYGDFFGCLVGPGTHEVKFTFDPKSFRLGRWLSATGLAAMLVCFAASFWGAGRTTKDLSDARCIDARRR